MSLIKLIILKIYSIISTLIENFLFKKNSNTSYLKKEGFIKVKLGEEVLKEIQLEKKIIRNEYFKILIMDEYQIQKILKKIFVINKISDEITQNTGFHYKVSYLILYETSSIPQDIRNQEIYANHWHFDKPYSRNTIKIIIPFDKIDQNSGAMQVLNIENSKKLEFEKLTPDLNFTGDQNDLLIFYPNLCAHKAGIPEKNISRKQLMLQLNPSNEWCYSKFLYNKQYNIEPKFPLKDLFESSIQL